MTQKSAAKYKVGSWAALFTTIVATILVGTVLVGTVLVALMPLNAVAWESRVVAQGQSEKAESGKADAGQAGSSGSRDDAKSNPAASPPADSKTKPKAKGKAAPGITPEREAAAKTFVAQHHPELGQLLDHLQESNKNEYQKAVRDLFRTSERLARVRDEDVDRYELELKLWQNQSRLDLLAAQYKMSPSSELKSQIKEAIFAQHQLKKSLVQLERQRTHDKLAKIDEQLKSLDKLSHRSLDLQLESIVGTAEKDATVTEKAKPESSKADKSERLEKPEKPIGTRAKK